jgi:nucleotide-binding universal stress UspA family protein
LGVITYWLATGDRIDIDQCGTFPAGLSFFQLQEGIMGFKDILVHLDTAPRNAVRLEIAASLAARNAGRLIGLNVYDMPTAEIFIGDPPMYYDTTQVEAILDSMRTARQQTSTKLRTEFDAALARHGVAGEWREVEGDVSHAVVLHGRYADLVVVGQPAPDKGGVIDPALLMGTGGPLLVVPYAGDFRTVGETVLIGWNATAEASRAAHEALPILQAAKKVIVLSINPERGISGNGDHPADDLIGHLAHHGVTAEAKHTFVTDISEGEALLSYASDCGADLLVCGMYGHSRLREFAFGGVTRSLLKAMTLPSLLTH